MLQYIKISAIILTINTCFYIQSYNQSLLSALMATTTNTEHSEQSNNTLFLNDNEIESLLSNTENVAFQKESIETQQKKSSLTQQEKEWTLLIYMAADNDLRGFALRNLQQMCSIGSTEHINIVVECHTRISNNKKITRRYYIEKDKMMQLTNYKEADKALDSGSSATLISFCNWATSNFPAKKYGLCLWNHGSGTVDPLGARVINPSTLFTFNPLTNKLELDRSIGFLEFINRCDTNLKERGICWDDETGHYLTNQDLDTALETICASALDGKNFEFIGFDACLMSMLEIASIVKKYANIMIASQELELAAGWRYDNILKPFKDASLNPYEFANHIVETYGDNYNKITDDYTLAALDLQKIEALEHNINEVALLLLEALKHQKDKTVKNAIRASKNKFLCTHFDEPSYIDLHHLYRNLLTSLKHFEFTNTAASNHLIEKLERILTEGCIIVEEAVVANRVGKNLKQARGISVYFPENRVHSSYKKTLFATTNAWHEFLIKYMVA